MMPPTIDYEDDVDIKNEEGWSSDNFQDVDKALAPLVTNLVAQMTPQSPELSSTGTVSHAGASRLQPSDDANTAVPRRRYAHGMEERLAAMPEVRPMPWRPGTEVPDELETGGESRRKQIRFACLLATRGNVVQVPCRTCSNGRGKFSECIALDAFFKGACASCQMSGRPNRCSIKQQDDSKITSDLAEDSTFMLPDHNQPYFNGYQQSLRTRAPRQSDSVFSSWTKPVDLYKESQSKVRSESTSNVDNVNNGTHPKRRRTEGSQVDKAQEQPRELTQQPRTVSAAANQSAISSTSGLRSSGIGMEINGQADGRSDYMRKEKASLIPANGEPLIDTLPKNKQRQIYGLVSGLQSGIDHLQKELEALKKAMGVEDTD
ncbi:hypothetical protein PVAG01_10096 [Phlyctema vagabunda]|uniref:Uncharacterized protein n=1 Tax=Phlyctema vagabunda TaxID=108571 RepID=A0ABR4P4Z4_9HELO